MKLAIFTELEILLVLSVWKTNRIRWAYKLWVAEMKIYKKNPCVKRLCLGIKTKV